METHEERALQNEIEGAHAEIQSLHQQIDQDRQHTAEVIARLKGELDGMARAVKIMAERNQRSN